MKLGGALLPLLSCGFVACAHDAPRSDAAARAASSAPPPCARANAAATEAEALEVKGLLLGALRAIAGAGDADAACPDSTARTAKLAARVRAELAAPADVTTLLRAGRDARLAGDDAGAARAFDHAISLAGGAQRREGAALAGVTSLVWQAEGDRAIGATTGGAVLVDAAAAAVVADASALVSAPSPVDDLVASTVGSATTLARLSTGVHRSFASVPGPGAFAFSPDRRFLAVRKPRNGFPFGVDIVDTKTLAPRGTPLMNTRCDDSAVIAWAPDSEHLAVGSKASDICIWDVLSPRLVSDFDLPVIRPPQGPAPPARWLVYTPNGAGLLGGAAAPDADDTAIVDLFRVDGSQRLSSLGERYPPVPLADGSTLLLGEARPPVIVGPDLHVTELPLLAADGPVSSDGQRILGTRGGATAVLDLRSGAVVATLAGSAPPVTSLAFSPSGRFVSAIVRGSLRIWDVATGAVRADGSDAGACALAPSWTAPLDVCADLVSAENR